MKKTLLLGLLIPLIMMNACKDKQKKLDYPETKKCDSVDVYFGTEIADPYRWLEDDMSEETKAWVVAQNKVTFSYLEDIPFRDKLKERFEAIWDYEKYGVPFKKGDYYFFFKNDGMQNQSVLYKQTGIDGKAEVFLDPNLFSEDGTVALAGISFSKDNKYMAYKTATGGSDWNEIFIMDIESGEKLEDHLEWVKFSGASWYKDGFYYSSYDKPKDDDKLKGVNEYHKVYYHKLGTKQEQDELVYSNPDYAKRNYSAQVTQDEQFLIISESESTSGNSLYIKDLTKANSNFVQVAEGFDYEYGIIEHDSGYFYMITNQDAPKQKLIRFKDDNPSSDNWETIIAESDNVLTSANFANHKIVATYMEDASSRAYVFSPKGEKLHEIKFPCLGSLAGFNGDKDENTAFFAFTSFTFPTTIYKYDVDENKYEIFHEPSVDFDATAYETKQIFYESKDGTKVPMFIVHKKGMELNGENPCMLYSYGGFNISLTPSFRISILPFLENGGIYCVANIRGGGEYGEKWHKDGTKMKKQNVFDDFIAAAEWLIKEKYTSSEKLAIHGGSNGGLLVGACMTQRPDLFKVALPAVGVLDMLRYHLFTIGWAWATDYGTSEDSKEMFEYLYKYSPLHNIKEGVEYPATLVTTADHDDRVVPAHSFKFIATLQEKQAGNNPVLIRIETDAGHGAGKPTTKQIEEVTDFWSFTMYNLDMEY
jgi:prolyl oligopeptidase